MAMTLWRRAGWGSALIEVQAAEYGLPLELVEAGDVFADPAARAAMTQINPLGQIPALRLEDGRLMTESAAITLWLADMTQSDALVPAPDAAERADFLRWLIWMVANIYPCFTYADEPTRFVADPVEARGFQARVHERLKALWLQAEAAASTPWFLGARFSALDLYAAVMLRWEPGPDWFAAHTPRLAAIAADAAARPAVAGIMAANFADQPG